MKKLKRSVLTMLLIQGAVLVFALKLRSKYLSQSVSENEVNAVAIMSGNQTRFGNAIFKGGYVRAIMGGVELDLRGTTIESKPAQMEATVFMGGVRLLVPHDWRVDMQLSPVMGGVADTRDRETASANPSADLVITGTVTMGGLAIAETST